MPQPVPETPGIKSCVTSGKMHDCFAIKGAVTATPRNSLRDEYMCKDVEETPGGQQKTTIFQGTGAPKRRFYDADLDLCLAPSRVDRESPLPGTRWS